jgi:hypothetical protein
MAAHSGPAGNALNGKVVGRQPQEDDMDSIPVLAEIRQPWSERSAGEGGLESEIHAFSRKLAHARKHHACRIDSRALRVESGQALGDRIGVDELRDAEGIAKSGVIAPRSVII